MEKAVVAEAIATTGGGGGNRTRVRKGSARSIYTLSRLVVYLTGAPLSGKRNIGQPRYLTRPPGASRPSYPEFASPLRIASGGLSGRRHGLSRESELVVVSYFCCHLINEVDGASACNSSLFLPVETCSPPLGVYPY